MTENWRAWAERPPAAAAAAAAGTAAPAAEESKVSQSKVAQSKVLQRVRPRGEGAPTPPAAAAKPALEYSLIHTGVVF